MSATKDKEQVRYSATVNMIAGGVGGAAAKSLLSPVQRIVVLKQLGEHRGMSSIQLAHMIHKKEGLNGFFKGNLTSIIIRFPYSGIQFLLYEKIKFWLQDVIGYDGSEKNKEHKHATASVNFNKFMMKCGAGGISATIAGVMVYPGEVIRLRLMSGEDRFRTISGTARLIWGETHSPRNFYRGLGASLAQRVPDILINFAVYETVKYYLLDEGVNDVLATIIGASLGAIASISLCFPLDIAKRRIGMSGQGKTKTVYRGVAHCLGSIWKEHGVRGWYTGAALEAGRCVPQVILMWIFIEETQKILSAFS